MARMAVSLIGRRRTPFRGEDSGSMLRDVTTYYLEMHNPAELIPKQTTRDDVRLERVGSPLPEFNRFFYTAVGGDWNWTDRLPWSRARWREYLERPELETWAMYVAGTPAGYFELEEQAGGDVEIAYFGLLPQFAGMGLGGYLLTACIERAWARRPKRVWVHTCTEDHPAALANYQARGMRLYKQETKPTELPEQPPGPWPGA